MSEGHWRLAAWAVLLWEVAGVAIYLFSVTVDPASLPATERATLLATPRWVVAAMAVAVWVGLAGALLFVLRRRAAEGLLLISLLAAIVSQAGPLVDPAMRAARSEVWWTMPVIVILLCEAAWTAAYSARRAGWLR